MNMRFTASFLGIALRVWWLLCHGQTAQAQYTTAGIAQSSGSLNCYDLTRNVTGRSGAVWSNQRIRLTKSFDMEFTLNFGSNDRGGDGIAMVLQTAGTRAVGSSGFRLGYEYNSSPSPMNPSLGIEFDTYQNPAVNDPPADHVALLRDGIVDHKLNAQLGTPAPISTTSSNVKNGRNYSVRVVWNAEARRIQVYVNCDPRIDQSVDLIGDIFKGTEEVYWGFTAGTGNLTNTHTVCLPTILPDTLSLCKGERVQLAAGLPTSTQYRWQPALGLDNPSSRTPTLTATSSQLYTVTYTGQCAPHTESVSVKVKNSGFTIGTDRKVCENQTVELSPQFDSPPPGTIKYRWSNGETTRQLKPAASGLYTLEVTADGCSAKDSARVTFVPLPKLDSEGVTTYDCPRGQPLLLSPRAMGSNLQYTWDFNGSRDSTLLVSTPGRYTVRISSDSACFLEKSFIVLDNCLPTAHVFVPDAFTPNGDGMNETFQWKSDALVDARMTVFNRWGEVVFFSKSADGFWDGSCGGSPCPASVYSWQLAYRSQQNPLNEWFVKKGTVVLIR